MKLQSIIENHWYKKINFPLSIFLFPFSLIFGLISDIRKVLYKVGVFSSNKLPIPVIIVGNISVGGSGKTPLCKHLVIELLNNGIKVGVILRGYGGKNTVPYIVTKNDSSNLVGDEALIYANVNIPVAIGHNRYLAGVELLKNHPNVQLIIADDGLQHYALKRDYEIVVIDSSRMLGNQWLLPLGPLRERITRLTTVDAVVLSGEISILPKLIKNTKLLIQQKLVLDSIYNPCLNEYVAIDSFKNSKVIALAAIGNPEKFFHTLTNVGIKPIKCLSFPDHYFFTVDDIPKENIPILVTEKDYTKLKVFKNNKIWVVTIKSELDSAQLVNGISDLVSK